MPDPIQITLDEATSVDLPAVLALVAAYHAEDRVPHDAATIDRTLAPMLDGTAGHIWLIASDGRVTGYVALCFGYSIEFGGRDAFIDEVYVSPEFRGRGIAAAALGLVETRARTLGVRALHLEVDRDTTPLLRLYERVGFRERNRYRLMSKRLPP